MKMETQLNKVRREAQEYGRKMKELEEEVNALEVECGALEHKASTIGVCTFAKILACLPFLFSSQICIEKHILPPYPKGSCKDSAIT